MLKTWPYHHPSLFAMLTMLVTFVPVVALAEVGRMRGRRLGIYLVTLAAILASLAAYDIWRDPLDHDWGNRRPFAYGPRPR
jgi:hypothetical protein